MGLESTTFISGLDTSNPLATDPKSQGDDHLRLIKSAVKATFPNLTGAVTPTHTELNYVAGVTSAIQTQLNGKYASGGALGTPSSGVLTNCTGIAAGLTAGNATAAATATAANGLATTTTAVVVSAASAPTVGQALVATSATSANWQTLASTLNSLSAATGAKTLGNGNNPITWNWTQTVDGQTAFAIGETTASTAGTASQDLFSLATLAASTANPLRVKARGVDTLLINRLGAVAITALSGAAGGGSAGSAVSLTGGAGTTAAAGGAVALTGGAGNTTGAGGTVNITGGASGVGAGSAGGSVNITGGTGSFSICGDVNISGGVNLGGATHGAVNITGGTSQTVMGLGGTVTVQAGANHSTTSANGRHVSILAAPATVTGNGGAVIVTAGNGASGLGGDITLTTGTGSTNGAINFVNTNVANGAVATTVTSLGPTGSSTTIVGWLAIKVAGTARFIPYW